MTDKEKVIKGIQCRLELKCNECPYISDDDVCDDCDSLFRDVLELLKEKEAVKPTWSCGKPFCGACGLRIRGGKFCSECGKPIAWEGR